MQTTIEENETIKLLDTLTQECSKKDIEGNQPSTVDGYPRIGDPVNAVTNNALFDELKPV